MELYKQIQNVAVRNTECTEPPQISHELVFSGFVLGDVMGPQREEIPYLQVSAQVKANLNGFKTRSYMSQIGHSICSWIWMQL